MIMIRQHLTEKWERYWKEKLSIKGYLVLKFAQLDC